MHPSGDKFKIRRFEAIVFDLDGTLYRHLPVRLAMAFELLCSVIIDPRHHQDFSIVLNYRNNREFLATNFDIDAYNRQYTEIARKLSLPRDLIEYVIHCWMHQRPLKYIKFAAYSSAKKLIQTLRDNKIKTAILSDYPTAAKLKRLEIIVDVDRCTLDMPSRMLKPHPGPLIDLLHEIQAPPSRTLVVGDRDDRDGAMAMAAGCKFFRINNNNSFDELLASICEDTDVI